MTRQQAFLMLFAGVTLFTTVFLLFSRPFMQWNAYEFIVLPVIYIVGYLTYPGRKDLWKKDN